MTMRLQLGDAAANVAVQKRGRRRARFAAVVGAVGVLALGGVPVPAVRDATAQAERAAGLANELAALEQTESAARSFGSAEQRRAANIAREHRRWFAERRELLGTRNHVLQLTRVLGITVKDLQVSEPQAPSDSGNLASMASTASESDGSGASDSSTTPSPGIVGSTGGGYVSETVELSGVGGSVEVQVLAGIFPKLDPPLRLVRFEQTRDRDPCEFTMTLERFFAQPQGVGQ